MYTVDLIDDGYNTDYTTNTQNSEGTYGLPSEFNANSAVYDAADRVNSNGDIIEGSQYYLNVNAAVATKTKGILHQGKGQRKLSRTLLKSSEMPTGLVAKMMASKQDVMIDRKTGQTRGYFIYSARITNIKYSHYCDSLVPEEQPAKKMHYRIN